MDMMTISKCFKLLSLSALLFTAIAAGAGSSAQADPAVYLKKGEGVKVICESGATPILKGNTVQCGGQVCKLTHWSYTSGAECDQGGCWRYETLSGYTLKQVATDTTIFMGDLNGADKESAIRDLQARFSKSCDIIVTE
jgi:hypothetical protein